MKFRLLFISAVLFLTALGCSLAAAQSPNTYVGRIGRMVSLKVPGGKEIPVYEVKSGPSKGQIVMLIHGKDGLTKAVKEEAERIHMACSSTVMVVDFFSGLPTSDTRTSGERNAEFNAERVRRVTESILDYTGKFGRLVTVGIGTGAKWSQFSAAVAGERGYGAILIDGEIHPDTALWKDVYGPVFFCMPGKDAGFPLTAIRDAKVHLEGMQKSAELSLQPVKSGFYLAEGETAVGSVIVSSHKEVEKFINKCFEVPLRKVPVPAEK